MIKFMNVRTLFVTCQVAGLALACQNGPKVTEMSTGPAQSAGISVEVDPSLQAQPGGSFANELHEVVVEEVMPATRYVFLKVREGSQTRWLAARKMEVTRGGTYYYRGGLLKTNFESKEFNRNFDTIYLVSNLVGANHALPGSSLPKTSLPAPQPLEQETASSSNEPATPHQGILSIADLVKDPKRYEGHTVQIHGTCVKINPNIMNRNWIHVRDGSRNDYDLVITSDSYVPEGSEFTMSATVALNRDFGAGYAYDLILENGVPVQ